MKEPNSRILYKIVLLSAQFHKTKITLVPLMAKEGFCGLTEKVSSKLNIPWQVHSEFDTRNLKASCSNAVHV